MNSSSAHASHSLSSLNAVAFPTGCSSYPVVLFCVVLCCEAAGADLSAVNGVGTSALHWSVHSDDEDTITGLIERIHRPSPSHSLSSSSPSSPSSSSSPVIPCFLWTNARNETPLHWAVDWQKATAVRVLLRHAGSKVGAVVSAVDEHGDTPLHRIPIDCDVHPQCRQIVADLIQVGANITAENHAHRTPLQYFRTHEAQVSGKGGNPGGGANAGGRGKKSVGGDVSGSAETKEGWTEEMEDRAAKFRQNLTAQFHTV